MPVKGFTLIELLVVLLIIGITLAFTMVAFGDFGQKKTAISTAEHCIQTITLIQHEAILRTMPLGIQVSEHGFEIVKFKLPNTWVPMDNQHVHQRLTFPKSLIASFTKRHDNTPLIQCSPSGDITPFTVYLGTIKQPEMVRIVGKSDGHISLDVMPNR
jgi:general secretion pathway protein H